MTTLNEASAALIKLTDELVGQKDALTAAASTASTKAQESANSATASATSASEAAVSLAGAQTAQTAAETARDQAVQITGLETVEDAVTAALDSSIHIWITEAESIAIRKAKHVKYAASDFIYHGKNSGISSARVNDGLTAYGAASVDHSNQFYLGPAHSSQSGDSPTVMPVFNMGGAEIPFAVFGDRFPFKLPPAEKGYRTYNSNGGESINYLTDAAPQYVGVAGYETLAERAILSGLSEEQEAICSANDSALRNSDFRFGNDEFWTLATSGTGTAVISDGVVNLTGSNLTNRGSIQAEIVNLTAGKTYKISWIVDVISGSYYFDGSPIGLQNNLNDSGLIEYEFEATQSSETLTWRIASSGGEVDISQFSLKPATQEIVKNRVDLSTLEIYQEESTDGEIFPFFIQNTNSAVISDVPMVLSKRPKSYFAQYEGQYDIPEELNDEFYCWDWPSLTTAQKKLVAQHLGETLFMGKNGYLVQDRVRARTFISKGNGDWLNVSSASSNHFLQSQGSDHTGGNPMHAQGAANAVSTYAFGDLFTTTGSYLNKYPEIGVFSTNNLSQAKAYNDKIHLYVVATHPRLNAAGWHPSYNPMGACTLDLDSSVFGSQVEINSFLDCCLNATNGDIASGVSGRPDGKYFDAIYPSGEGGIVDHRLKYGAWDASSAEQAATVRGEVISGVYRGREKLTKTFVLTKANDGIRWVKYTGNLQFSAQNWAPVDPSKVNFFGGFSGARFTLIDNYQGVKVTGHITDVHFQNNLNSNNGHFDVVEGALSTNMSSSTSDDFTLIIEMNSSNIKGGAGSVSSDLVDYLPTVEGDFQKLNVVATLDELLANPLLKDGFVGSWVPVIPDGTAQDVPMTRKSLDSELGYSLSGDGGVTWTGGDTTTFDDRANDISLSLAATDVGVYDYTAFAKQTEQSENLVPFNGMKGMGEVFNAQSYAKEWGVLLFESTLGEVSKVSYGSGKTAMQHQPLLGISQDVNGLINTGAGQLPYAEPTNLTAGEKALRVLTHQIKENGQANLNFIANELTYDATAGNWGDSGEIKVSASGSFTDDNGTVCKSDIHKLAKPYGWIKDKV
ncbi:hypothetical protein R7P75_04495 [Vibrio sp. 2175-1]|uniref:hypothetical protein n=1 Tax=Vibrio TaxID=662 RepID=UPI001CDD57B9|nr:MULTISPECIES: hypothetical protein [Vibrio]MCA2497777.1 hypothetical protein [Vibrio alginolyticus]MDW2217464.1 hypothetical protein [Vibrio sp. 2175-1]